MTTDSFGLIYPVDAVNRCNMASFGLMNSNPTETDTRKGCGRVRLQSPFSLGEERHKVKTVPLENGGLMC